MRIGSADLYANHPMVVVGSDHLVQNSLSLNGSAAVASESHVTVATRGQAGLVRVSLWNVAGPRIGAAVFDGHLNLASPLVTVCEVEGISRFSVSIGQSGLHRFVVLVDDPGFASRVDVIVDCGDDVRTLTAVPPHRLFDVSYTPGSELGPSDELALILSGHDMPMNRLTAALKLTAQAHAPRAAVRSFWIRMIVEWIRWLSPWQSLAASQAIGAKIEERIVASDSGSIDAWATGVAMDVCHSIVSKT